MCKVVVPALKSQVRGTHESVLRMLSGFLSCLSTQTEGAAMKLLVSGGLLELTMAHMADAGPEEIHCAQMLFNNFLKHPDGRDELSKKAIMDQFTQWCAKWLTEVRNIGPVSCWDRGKAGVLELGQKGRR